MDDSKNHQKMPRFHDHHGSVLRDRVEFLSFDSESDRAKFLTDATKNWLLFGADKVLMSRNFSATSARLKILDQQENPHEAYCNVRDGKNKSLSSLQENKKVREKHPLLQPTSKLYAEDKNACNEEYYVDVSKVVNCPSGDQYSEFPLNVLAFMAISMIRLFLFQIRLFTSFFTIPIWLSYSAFMFIMFPFHTIASIRKHLTKRFLKMWSDLYMGITGSLSTRLKAHKSVLNLAIRFGCALFWSIYVWFMLVGLLLSGFVIGGLAMRRLVLQQPIQTTQTLNFDYTKPSPVALVPVMSSPGAGVSSGLISKESAEAVGGARAIPYNHKLQLTVSLTLPESEYNRKLGVFQVRVDFLSASGKVTASSSYPCMLRFKSQPIRFVETIFKSAPLISGFQTESQILNIKVSDFTEGYEATACLKVTLEQRAEHQPGKGIPQIYSAALALESELRQFKKMIWYWRRTIFVWISFVSFLTELAIVLVFFRPLIIPRVGLKAADAKKDSHRNKISWYKTI